MMYRPNLGDRLFGGLLYTIAIGLALAVVLGFATVIATIVMWSWPWNWQDHDYARQATNITYAQAVGVDNGVRQPALSLVKIAPTNFASPTCPYHGGDLFNPTGSTAPQFGNGWALTMIAAGVRQTIDLPDGSVHQVTYGGSTLQVQFNYNKVVLYYDNFYDSLWTNTGARGPKDVAISCMAKQNAVGRMLTGLRYITVFEPVGYGK